MNKETNNKNKIIGDIRLPLNNQNTKYNVYYKLCIYSVFFFLDKNQKTNSKKNSTIK